MIEIPRFWQIFPHDFPASIPVIVIFLYCVLLFAELIGPIQLMWQNILKKISILIPSAVQDVFFNDTMKSRTCHTNKVLYYTPVI